jgi:hypothetical protein
MATFTGTPGNDLLTGVSGANLFLGSGGNDIIRGGPQYAGIDTLSYAAWGAAVQVTLPVIAYDNSATGTVVKAGAGGGTDTFSGIDQVVGTRFDDSFTGRPGILSLYGSPESLRVTSGPGNDTINGAGSFYTTADYSDTTRVVVDLTAGTAVTPDGTDRLVEVRAVLGSPGDDVLLGSAGSDWLYGGAGNDWLDGRGGGGVLSGGGGNDVAVFSASLSQLVFSTSVHSYTPPLSVASAADGFYAIGGIERLMAGGKMYGQGVGVTGVDTVSYYVANRDVQLAEVDAETHFFGTGWLEGRNPNALFSVKTYLEVNPDIRTAGINPLTHYLQAGWKEGRDPAVNFDTETYLARNPDVAAAGLNPLLHYLEIGSAERRSTYTAIGPTAAANGFDAEFYLLNYADIRRAGIDAEAHYRAIGAAEGRSANAFFNGSGYLAAYADVRAAGVDPLTHYLSEGWKEGRDPSGQFDTLRYLADNPDVTAAGINPLLHYLGSGHAEGRVPVADYIFHQD